MRVALVRRATAVLVLAGLLASGVIVTRSGTTVTADRFPECTADDQNQIPLPWWCR